MCPPLVPIRAEEFERLVAETGLSQFVVMSVLLNLPGNRRSSRRAVNKARLAQLGMSHIALIGETDEVAK